MGIRWEKTLGFTDAEWYDREERVAKAIYELENLDNCDWPPGDGDADDEEYVERYRDIARTALAAVDALPGH